MARIIRIVTLFLYRIWAGNTSSLSQKKGPSSNFEQGVTPYQMAASHTHKQYQQGCISRCYVRNCNSGHLGREVEATAGIGSDTCLARAMKDEL